MKTRAGSSGNRRVQPCLSSQRSLKGGLGSFFLAALASASVSRGVAVVVASAPCLLVRCHVRCRQMATEPLDKFTPALSCR